MRLLRDAREKVVVEPVDFNWVGFGSCGGSVLRLQEYQAALKQAIAETYPVDDRSSSSAWLSAADKADSLPITMDADVDVLAGLLLAIQGSREYQEQRLEELDEASASAADAQTTIDLLNNGLAVVRTATFATEAVRLAMDTSGYYPVRMDRVQTS